MSPLTPKALCRPDAARPASRMPFPRFSDNMDFFAGFETLPQIVDFDVPEFGRIERLINWVDRVEPFDATMRNLPEALRRDKRWIWLEPRIAGAAAKSVYLCRGVKLGEALSPANFIRYCASWGEFKDVEGCALVLNGSDLGDTGLIPVAVEITSAAGLTFRDVMNLYRCLGSPYLEWSHEGRGWTIIGLVEAPVPTTERGGIRVSTSDGYVELYGVGGFGDLKNISHELDVFLNGRPVARPVEVTRQPQRTISVSPLTPRDTARLIQALGFVSADCDYARYRDIVWAILGSNCQDSEALARSWCMTAPHLFDERSFQTVVRSFNAALTVRPTVGSIFFHAKANGWDG